MASIKDFICETSTSVKDKFHGSNLPTDELNNLIDEMLLFYKGNLVIENISRNKHVSKRHCIYLNMTNSQDAEEFLQGYCDNNETIRLSYKRYNVCFH